MWAVLVLLGYLSVGALVSSVFYAAFRDEASPVSGLRDLCSRGLLLAAVGLMWPVLGVTALYMFVRDENRRRRERNDERY